MWTGWKVFNLCGTKVISCDMLQREFDLASRERDFTNLSTNLNLRIKYVLAITFISIQSCNIIS